MANAVTTAQQAQLPDYLRVPEEESNIQERVSVPSLGVKGKSFVLAIGGEKKPILTRDADGDMVPMTTLPIIILDYAKRRGRTYFTGGYNPDETKSPDCWSDDGIKPDASVDPAKRQHHQCEGCPMSIKGSKMSDNGKPGYACTQHRMLAVIPANKPDHEPLRFKIAATSDWDGDNKHNEQEGWFAFSNYIDSLVSMGVKLTTQVITKIKFDASVDYPKLLFSRLNWTPPEVFPLVKDQWKDDRVKKLLGGTYTPNGVDGEPKAAIAPPAPPAPPPAAAAPPPPPPRPAPAPAPAPAAASVEAAEWGDVPASAPAPAKGKGKAAAAPETPKPVQAPVAAVSPALEGMLAGWGE